jgi:hypothetical protein
MQPLNLPPFEYNFKIEGEKQYIFDSIRKKYLLNTPEEWVRQHFINFLINHRNYSKNLIKIETGLKYNQRNKRTDIQVFDSEGKLNILVECKAPNIVLNDKVITQILQYHKVLNASVLAITNGIEHVFISLESKDKIQYLSDLPMNSIK